MRLVTFASAAAVALFVVSTASATEVTRSVEIKAPAKKVWDTASPDFCGLGTFHPAVETCVLSEKGKVRTLSLKGGGTIVEKRTAWSKKARSYSYVITESPLPVANYASTFSVKRGAKGVSTVTWTGTFEPKGASEDEAKKVIDGIYSSGLDALKTKV